MRRLELKGKPFGAYSAAIARKTLKVCGIVFMKWIAHSKSMKNIQKPFSSHTLLSRSSSSTAARLGTILSASESVVCPLALFVDHPVFHQKHLTRYPSFPTPSLKQMATINLLKRCMVLRQPNNSNLHFQSDQQNPRSYPSVPASNMYVMLTSWFNARSVRCGVCYTGHENYHLACESN